MDIRTAFSSYLKAADIPAPTSFTIKVVRREAMKDLAGKEEIKPVVYFTNHEKGLVLNRTNMEAIAYACQTYEDESWPGHVIILYTPMIEAFGKTAPAIRVQVQQQAPPLPTAAPLEPPPKPPVTTAQPQPNEPPQPTQAPAGPGGGDMSDEIPFAADR